MLNDKELQNLAPFPLARVPGAKVVEKWHELRRLSGVAPILMGNPDSAATLLKLAQLATESAESVVARAERLDVDAWMAQRMRASPGLYAVEAVDRPWDGARRRVEPFLPAYDHRGRPYPEIIFALMPVPFPWYVPTHMRTPGVGTCPDSAVQMALFRRWYERHGAILCTIGDGIVELQVDRPVTDPEAARQLALEQFFFCPELVHQGVLSLGNLAASLMTNRTWYFWWELDVHLRPED